MLMAIHPDLVHADRGEPGYTGDLEHAVGAMFSAGVHSVAANGVIGDPAQSSAAHGERYWEEVLAVTLRAVS